MNKIVNADLARRVAMQIAGNTGIEVVCGNTRAVLPADQRDAFRV